MKGREGEKAEVATKLARYNVSVSLAQYVHAMGVTDMPW